MRTSSILLPHRPLAGQSSRPARHIDAPAAESRAAGRLAVGTALRALELGLALGFFVAGAASLADVPAPGVDFELLTDLTGAGAWLRIVAGAIEVLGALGLAVPALAGAGAVLIGALMALAAAAYVVVLHVAPTTPVVFLVALGLVAYGRHAALIPQRAVRDPSA